MSDTPPIVIDTNIYISTAISPNGTVAQALKKAELTGSPIIQTPQTMAELEEKLITNPSEKILRLVPEIAGTKFIKEHWRMAPLLRRLLTLQPAATSRITCLSMPLSRDAQNI